AGRSGSDDGVHVRRPAGGLPARAERRRRAPRRGHPLVACHATGRPAARHLLRDRRLLRLPGHRRRTAEPAGLPDPGRDRSGGTDPAGRWPRWLIAAVPTTVSTAGTISAPTLWWSVRARRVWLRLRRRSERVGRLSLSMPAATSAGST